MGHSLGSVWLRQAALESLGRAQGLAKEVAKCLEAGHVEKRFSWDQDRDPLVRAAACKAMALLEEGEVSQAVFYGFLHVFKRHWLSSAHLKLKV